MAALEAGGKGRPLDSLLARRFEAVRMAEAATSRRGPGARDCRTGRSEKWRIWRARVREGGWRGVQVEEIVETGISRCLAARKG